MNYIDLRAFDACIDSIFGYVRGNFCRHRHSHAWCRAMADARTRACTMQQCRHVHVYGHAYRLPTYVLVRVCVGKLVSREKKKPRSCMHACMRFIVILAMCPHVAAKHCNGKNTSLKYLLSNIGDVI
jgi:hypothetical protein